MADDNRLEGIKEGAGLEDSRINQEFIDFIRKWSTPVLLVLALLTLAYFLNNKRIEAKQAHIDEAFQQLNLSMETSSPSPDALRRIAEDYKDVVGVRLLATMGAADEYLRAVQRGVKPGSPIDPNTGEFENTEDLLTDEDRGRFLGEAETLYKRVHTETVDRPKLAVHTLGALYGLAAVSESRGDFESARNVLEQAVALSEKHGYMEHAAIAQSRIAALPSLGGPVHLVSKNELPEIPALKALELEAETSVAGEETQVGPQLPEDAGGADAEDSESDEGGVPSADSDDPPRDEAGEDGDAEDGEGDAENGGEDTAAETTDDGGR